MKYVKSVKVAVSAWPNLSVHAHRFGGREFLFGAAEVGHVHTNGTVDVPFTRPIHDVLLSEGLAEEHHWVPNSGWVTFRMNREEDLSHALWLLRLSYLRYALKTAADPWALLEQESEKLHLNPHFRSLLEKHLTSTTNPVATEPLSA